MPPPPKPLMPLWLAISIIVTAIVFGCGYVSMKVWFYFLNARFRKHSDPIRRQVAEEAAFRKGRGRMIFVGFFHPYWYVLNDRNLPIVMLAVEVNGFCGPQSRLSKWSTLKSYPSCILVILMCLFKRYSIMLKYDT